MAILTAAEIGKEIQGEPLLRNVSFKLERGERLTLSGRNGSGKTTLLRILAGETPRDSGELAIEKSTRITLHDQRPPRNQDLTLGDYILAGSVNLLRLEGELADLEQAMANGQYDPATLDRYARAQTELEAAGGYGWRDTAFIPARGLGFTDAEFDRKLATFSGGELTRASLGRALTGTPDLILLDEPTNHLDIESLEWLEEYLIALNAAIILVAHDRWFLESVGTAVLELEGGRARYFAGQWHAWRKEKAQRELAQGKAITKQEAEIARMERFVERWSGGTRSRQAQAQKKQLGKVQKVERAPQNSAALSFAFKPPERSGRTIFELENATLTIGDRTLLKNGNLWLERNEHVSLVGTNGSGKTTLMETLAGNRPLEGGKFGQGHSVQIGYLSQHAQELDANESVLMMTGRETGLTPGKARALLGRFMFTGDSVMKPVSTLSGGERQRLALAILVSSGANVLLLDEPTNHLDIESREALEDALAGYDGAVLVISHDRALLDAVGTRTIELTDGQLRSYPGGWTEYLSTKESATAPTVNR